MKRSIVKIFNISTRSQMFIARFSINIERRAAPLRQLSLLYQLYRVSAPLHVLVILRTEILWTIFYIA